MPEIGKINKLKAMRSVEPGVYLDGLELGDILLPTRYVPNNYHDGDMIDVFLYFDSEDRLIATTLRPYAMVGEAGWLEVVDVNNFGAFLDWGLAKDLLVPFREQQHRMEKGKSYMVFVYIDEKTHRITASSNLNKFLTSPPDAFAEGQSVDLILGESTELGYKTVIDNRAQGIIYHTEIFQELSNGQRVKGFIKKIRDDGKIDLSLQETGYGKVADISEQIIQKIAAHGGYIEITDKSSAELIYKMFGISKKNFKKAIGALYKAHRIVLEKEGIALS
ncbi:MAG: S1-like domain-containing RNA-binding protein [Desulfobacteraceae bacterium]|jgi:predicted RNA-binding protein (virulence factor B family)|nr:S1-like domain-containing RNA-binding protein [Desulfobacteraceae bacterium]